MQNSQGPRTTSSGPGSAPRRSLSRLTKCRAGVATIEFALVLPILVALLLISLHFGRILYTTVTIGHAARAGAQYGAQTSVMVRDTAGIRLAATAEAVNVGSITVASQFYCKCETGAAVNCVTGSCGAYGVPQLYVHVTASKNVSWLLPWHSTSGTVPVSRTAILRVQ